LKIYLYLSEKSFCIKNKYILAWSWYAMISFEVKGKSKREGVKKLNVSTKNSSTIRSKNRKRKKREKKRREKKKNFFLYCHQL